MGIWEPLDVLDVSGGNFNNFYFDRWRTFMFHPKCLSYLLGDGPWDSINFHFFPLLAVLLHWPAPGTVQTALESSGLPWRGVLAFANFGRCHCPLYGENQGISSNVLWVLCYGIINALCLSLSVSLSLSISKHLGGISMRAPTCGHLRLSLQLPELPHSVVFAELGSLCSDVGGPTTVDPWFHGGPSCNNDFSIHRIQPQIFLPPPSVLSLCTPGVLEGFALQTAPFLMAV